MKTPYTCLVGLALAAGFPVPGCIWACGGKVVIQPYSVADMYRRVPSGLGFVVDPQEEELSNVPRVVLVPFHFYLASGRWEILEARAAKPGDQVTYPVRLYPIIPFTIIGNQWEIGYGMFAFAEDHWPVVFSVYGSDGPSGLYRFPNSRHAIPKGAAAVACPVFYRKSRPFDMDITKAAGFDEEVRADYLFPLFDVDWRQFASSVDGGSRVSDVERRMVYGQLLEVVNRVLEFNLDDNRRSVYARARMNLKAKVGDLAQVAHGTNAPDGNAARTEGPYRRTLGY